MLILDAFRCSHHACSDIDIYLIEFLFIVVIEFVKFDNVI